MLFRSKLISGDTSWRFINTGAGAAFGSASFTLPINEWVTLAFINSPTTTSSSGIENVLTSQLGGSGGAVRLSGSSIVAFTSLEQIFEYFDMGSFPLIS